MIEPDFFTIFLVPINRLPIRYMVTGSTASAIYGEPRFTHDMDLVIEMANKDINTFRAAFPVPMFYCPPEDVVRHELSRETRGHFNIIQMESGLKADVYLAGKDAFHRWGIEHSEVFEIHGISVRLAPREYVIISKLEFYKEGGSEKHLDDIRGILRISGERIDTRFLTEKIRLLGLESEWEKAKGLDFPKQNENRKK
jgi:hypothetical protein